MSKHALRCSNTWTSLWRWLVRTVIVFISKQSNRMSDISATKRSWQQAAISANCQCPAVFITVIAFENYCNCNCHQKTKSWRTGWQSFGENTSRNSLIWLKEITCDTKQFKDWTCTKNPSATSPLISPVYTSKLIRVEIQINFNLDKCKRSNLDHKPD